MSINNIGLNISGFRKGKGITQDELAKNVGVSAQAVSKWENGGVPDIELLPKIADFFGISIDRLFGRSITEYIDIKSALSQKIINSKHEERFSVAFDYCWEIERALTGQKYGEDNLEGYINKAGESEQQYSSMLFDEGFTRMGIANRLQYFLIVPEAEDKKSAYFDGINYTEFFADFADNAVFNTLVMLNKRDNEKSFTPKLLINNLKINEEKAIEVIGVLKKYKLISSAFIELDDTIQEVYNFIPTPSFIALLIFAREMIDTPDYFSYYYHCRKKPYLI